MGVLKRIIHLAPVGVVAFLISISCGDPAFDAQAAVANACDDANAVTDFDVTVTLTAPGQRFSYKVQVTGTDYHLIGNLTVEPGTGDGRQAFDNTPIEFIGVGSVHLWARE